MESKGSFESGAGGDGQRGKAGGLPPGVQSGLSKSPGPSPQRRARPGADCVRGRELGERTPGARPPASTPPQRAESPPLLKPRLGGKTEWPSRRPRRITGGRPARNRCAWERAPTRVAGRGRAGPRGRQALLETLREPRVWRTRFLPGAGRGAALAAIGRTGGPPLAEAPPTPLGLKGHPRGRLRSPS